ncbi:serine/threonine-protein phosphatase 6 regulatory ankyrin repeat subunit B-like [Haliotis rufescens]|uniref:serine/threonine-protein phosphatase 6 regulatory ankyrin repeat subunit B-like n=1 Tax=Haliotis rufescens TaxID=6454 RepID=UPI00201F7B7A|nr:serine/threonine-protein phosphatase 6 regulatory ankyrin repeat subunit B-like [Haliotis rufescens]XP_048253426.1 serine/threonine-protein phosphatase 6 regulatory ankyrin repeat subunit B-like [Haliotis rufescens]XP_048253427.1 serine/threonine-protein phosphatase 6 regulatory ankyrin repeat subunit B-like [Haliotis rufescens]
MASSGDLTRVSRTQDDLEEKVMEVITSGGTPQSANSAALDLQIRDAKGIFVETESFRTVKRKLIDFGHVTICGASGEGKTTAALVLGSQYRQRGYTLAFVDRIEQFDLDSFMSSSHRIFLIIDDMFGTVGLSTDVSQQKTFLNKLHRHIKHSKKTSDRQGPPRKQQAKEGGEHDNETSAGSDPVEIPKKDIRVVFTSSTYNFHDELAQLQYEGFSLFKGQTVVNLTKEKKHRYTPAEKKAIFEHHRKIHRESSNEDCEDLLDSKPWDIDSNIVGIPLACKLYFEFSSLCQNAKKFFQDPLYYLRQELKNLLRSGTDQSAVLVLMLLNEDKMDLTKLETDGKDQKLDNMVRTVLEFMPSASYSGMYKAAKTLRGTFFTCGALVGFAHSSIYDACACALYDISPTFVLTHCSDNFIYQRVRPQPVQKSKIDDHLHMIYVSEVHYDILTTRLAESIKHGQFSTSVTHPILHQEKIALQLLKKLCHDRSMDERWFHKRENGKCFLFWAVLGHNAKLVQNVEQQTGGKFTQTEITEAMVGCVLKNNLTALKWLFPGSNNPGILSQINKLLLLAAENWSSETLVHLLEKGADVFTTDGNLQNIIHLICKTGQEKTLKILIKTMSRLFNDQVMNKVMNSVDAKARTPLMVAALNGSEGCFQLLKSLSNSNKQNKDIHGNEILHLACRGGSTAIVQHLVSRSNINSKAWCDLTPVMMAAVGGHQGVFDLLVSKHADLTMVDRYGDSILHLACLGGNEAIVQHLVSSLNINNRDLQGWTPIMMAAAAGTKSVFDLLVSMHADLTQVDVCGDSLLHLACQGGDTAIVHHLVSSSNINSLGRHGWTPIMRAVATHHQSAFDLLLSRHADLTLVDDYGDSLLHLACQIGNTAIVKYLVSPSNINITGKHGWTPVMTAAVSGHKNVFDFLILKHADLTLVDNDGDSLLHHASQGGNTDIVNHVVSPSNINSCGKHGWTPVMTAAVVGLERVFDLLVSKHADLTLMDSYGDSLLHLACRGGNTAVVQQVLSPYNINKRGLFEWTPVMVTAFYGQPKVFDLLVSKNADLTLVDMFGDSVLHVSCRGGNETIVQHLVSPSNIHKRGQFAWTPVMAAAFNGHQGIFYHLVSKNADLTLVDNFGDSLLHLACRGGNPAIVQHLVSPSNINVQGRNGWTPVMAAASKGHQSVFDFLVSKNAVLTLVDNNGDSLLHLACRGGNPSVVQYLVSPSYINRKGQQGWTPVMTAAVVGHQNVFELLVSEHADLTLVDNNDNNIIHLACEVGNTAVLEHLVSPSNINSRGQCGLTPVMKAAVAGHVNAFDLLVSKNADLSLKGNFGNSLIHLACEGGDRDILQRVVSPANINNRGLHGWTSIMKAAATGHQGVFDFLVSNNADLLLVDDYGDSLLHLACRGGNTAIVQQLISPYNINSTGSKGWTPVVTALYYERESVFNLLVSLHADLTLVNSLQASTLED